MAHGPLHPSITLATCIPKFFFFVPSLQVSNIDILEDQHPVISQRRGRPLRVFADGLVQTCCPRYTRQLGIPGSLP